MNNTVSLIRIPFALLQTDYNNISVTHPTTNTSSRGSTSFQFNFKKIKNFFKNSPYIYMIAAVAIVVLIAFFAFKTIFANSQGSVASATDTKANVNKPIAQQKIDKVFMFPLSDQSGKEVSKLKYEIQNAELRNEIIIKGEKATAVSGRVFLILNIKITNNYSKSIQLNSRDYVRLIVNNSTEKLAPDIHNDPVEVQAISTKFTRLGFPINDTDKNIVLQIGEISGKKELIELHLN